eukprot:2750386-Rhodomonas_salina.1
MVDAAAHAEPDSEAASKARLPAAKVPAVSEELPSAAPDSLTYRQEFRGLVPWQRLRAAAAETQSGLWRRVRPGPGALLVNQCTTTTSGRDDQGPTVTPESSTSTRHAVPPAIHA